jgi:6-pyruvoyltetrahydropterin/6-carboxytetrahydropterin synthase
MAVAEITKQFTFEAAHRLPMVPPEHKCARVHGHSFKVDVTVRGPIDEKMGWIVDFAALADAWAPLFKLLDHRLLNDIEGLANPTSELLALWVAARFSIPGVVVSKVHVSETCTSSCTITF